MGFPRSLFEWRFGKFLVVGVVSALLDIGFLWIALGFLPSQGAFSVGYVIGIAAHFCLNKWWTFQCRRSDIHVQLIQYAAVTAVNYVVQFSVFSLVIFVLHAESALLPAWAVASGIQQVFAKMCAIPPSTIVGFLLFRKNVFSQGKPSL